VEAVILGYKLNKCPWDNLQIKGGGKMIEEGEVRPEGGICEPCSDISKLSTTHHK
jgi:hypothetical protein